MSTVKGVLLTLSGSTCCSDGQYFTLLRFGLKTLEARGLHGVSVLRHFVKKKKSLSTCSTDSSFTTIIISHFLKFAFCPPGIILSFSFASAPLVGSFQT